MIMLAASILAMFAAGDCHFVTVNATLVDPYLTTIFPDTTITVQPNNKDRGLGFFVWEGVDGQCTWMHEDYNYTEAAWNKYSDFLGSDWDAPRAMACFAAAIAWTFLIWLLVMSCVAHIKIIRYVVAFALIVLLPIFQSITFAVLDSDFCADKDCQIGRSARFAAVAVGLYALTGILLLFTKDYPGARSTQQPAAAAAAQKHNEELTVDHRDEEEPHHVGFEGVREVPIDSDMVDVALVDSNAATNKATIY